MKIEDIRSFAKVRGIKPDKLFKNDLIKEIQRREGNFDCFASAYGGECDRYDCLWRDACFEEARKGGSS